MTFNVISVIPFRTICNFCEFSKFFIIDFCNTGVIFVIFCELFTRCTRFFRMICPSENKSKQSDMMRQNST